MEDITLAYLDAQRWPQIWSFADVDFWVGDFLFLYCQFRYISLISFVLVNVRSCYLFTIHFQIMVCWRFHFQMKWKEQSDRLIIWVTFTEAKVSWFGPMIVRPLFICNKRKYDSIKVIFKWCFSFFDVHFQSTFYYEKERKMNDRDFSLLSVEGHVKCYQRQPIMEYNYIWYCNFKRQSLKLHKWMAHIFPY